MQIWSKIKRLFGVKYKPRSTIAEKYNDEVTQRYLDAGLDFGDAVSYIYMGECVGFEKLLDLWEKAEQAYAAKGFKTLSLDVFIDAGGWGRDLENIEVHRAENEEPIYHAKFYRENYLGKMGMSPVMQEVLRTGEPQFGHYAVPGTKHLEEPSS